MASNSRIQLENWVKSIRIDNKFVLDIGGSQNPVKDRLASANNSQFVILDLESPHESKKGPDIVCDINGSINPEDEKYSVGKFDVAFCLEVTEYLWNPYGAFKNINKFLKEKGELYISFHFIYPHHNPVGLDYLRYTKWGVQKLLTEAGFSIEEIVPRVAADEEVLNIFFSSEGMRAAKEFRGHNEIGYLVRARKI